jgi:hypothetical protein
MICLAILVSAILYRVPRGGPDGRVWKDWIGFAPGSRVGASVWALWTAGTLTLLAGLPLWAIPVVFALLTLAEMPGYMQWVSSDKVDVKRLTLRGCLLLNPLMGLIYEGCRRYAKGWPIRQPILDGWTAYAELMCGLVTASSYALICSGLALWLGSL